MLKNKFITFITQIFSKSDEKLIAEIVKSSNKRIEDEAQIYESIIYSKDKIIELSLDCNEKYRQMVIILKENAKILEENNAFLQMDNEKYQAFEDEVSVHGDEKFSKMKFTVV